jgi:hypothetical protein
MRIQYKTGKELGEPKVCQYRIYTSLSITESYSINKNLLYLDYPQQLFHTLTIPISSFVP